MKKLFIVSLCTIALAGCKTEIEKEVSLNILLNEPLKTDTALLNVEISSCNNREDSRLPSDSLIKIQQKIPNVFPQAKYKECFSKKYNSFASFEIPIGIGKVDDSTEMVNDINIYSYKNRQLNIRTSKQLAQNIRDFVKREYISNLEFNILLSLTNDTGNDEKYNIYSAYLDNTPRSFQTIKFEKGKKYNIKLSNVSSDMLWKYNDNVVTTVLSNPFNLDEVTENSNK